MASALQEPVYLASGFYFPVRAIGFWTAIGASVIPLTLGLDAMRQIVFGMTDVALLPVGWELTGLAVLTVVYFVFALRALSKMEHLAKQGREVDAEMAVNEHHAPAGRISWREKLQTFRFAAWLGWQVESNWADPLLFAVYSLLKPLAAALILVVIYRIVGSETATRCSRACTSATRCSCMSVRSCSASAGSLSKTGSITKY